jgi:RNA methyltransferase, TrmH family
MISKSKLKYIASLNQKKFRQKEQKFIVEGINSVSEGLGSSFKCEGIYYTKEFLEAHPEIINSINKTQAQQFQLTNSEFSIISDTKSPQGIAATFQIPKREKLASIIETTIVYLDNINDPGNLGTIIRTCDWFGVSTILLSSECAEYTNSKVVRSSAGSIFNLKIFDNSTFEDLRKLKSDGYKIFCSDLSGENIYKVEMPEKLVIIFSNEAHGPSEEILKITNKKISISKSGNAESLNVAIAAGIILSHLKK